MNRLPSNLPTLLHARGVSVVEEVGWLTRGSNFTDLVGGMIHHWGSSAAGRGTVRAGHCWPRSAKDDPARVGGGLRTDKRVVYNIFVDQNATVHLIAAGAANFSSCRGSRVVLNQTRLGIAPSGTARQRRLKDDLCGNRFFWNLVGEHSGDGSPMNTAQEHAIITTIAVITEALDHTINQAIGHLEWTARKIDPRWNGPGNRTPALRVAAQQILDGGSVPSPEPQEEDTMLMPPTIRYGDGAWRTPQTPDADLSDVAAHYVGVLQALMTIEGFIDEHSTDDGVLPVDRKFGRGTRAALEGFQTSARLDPDGVCGSLTWTALIHHE